MTIKGRFRKGRPFQYPDTEMSKRTIEAYARMDGRLARAKRRLCARDGELAHCRARIRRLEALCRKLEAGRCAAYREARAFRLKVCELEERIADTLDPWASVPERQAEGRLANGPVKPERWFYEPAELAEALTRMAKVHPEADRVVFRLGGEYVMAKSVAFEEMPLEGEGDWVDPAIVFNLQ